MQLPHKAICAENINAFKQRNFDLREQETVYRKGKMISGNDGNFPVTGEFLQ